MKMLDPQSFRFFSTVRMWIDFFFVFFDCFCTSFAFWMTVHSFPIYLFP